MPEKKISELSLEELKKKEKMLKTLFIITAVTIVLGIAAGVFITIQEGVKATSVFPFAMIAVLVPSMAGLKSVRQEIKSRQQ